MADEKDNIKLKDKNYKSVDVDDGDDYDPHLHREVEHPTTNMETLVHILKGSLGTGILAMPQAFNHAGYVSGLINTFIIGAVCTYCLHILVRSQYTLCKRHRVPIMTYPISMKIALAEGPPMLRFLSPYAIFIVDSFLIIYQLGICCVYIVFVASNIKQVVDIYTGDWNIKIHMLIILVPLLLLYSIRNLKLLAPFSVFANVLTFIGLGLLLKYLCEGLPSLSEREPFQDIQYFPFFFGTVLFALEAVGVIIALENNMKTPKGFGGWTGVLNIGMFVIVTLYAAMGFLGYLKYGSNSKPSITLNPDSKDILAQVIKIIFAIAIFISYALQGFVPVDIIWNTYLKKKVPAEHRTRAIIYEYLVRFAVVVITFCLAVAIPLLDLFITLFGAFCLSVLGLAFPALLEICVLWPRKLPTFVLIKDIILIIFGFVGLVTGTFVSVRAIIITLTSDN